MYYEVYIDSMFLLNFTMNLYLLMLVNKNLNRTATRIRVFAGAALSGIGYCLMFLIPLGNAVIKTLFMGVFVNSGILLLVFKPGSIKAFIKIFETMILYLFLMGGSFWLLINHVKFFRKYMMSVMGILAFGGLILLIFSKYIDKHRKKDNNPCKVILLGKNGSNVIVQAIVDTGNCLKEPISGKPVSVLEKSVFHTLFGEEGPHAGFRAIPYRSVGCERGIMKGYVVPMISIEQDGIKKVCSDVYVGISDKPLSSTDSYKMLLHPKLLEK